MKKVFFVLVCFFCKSIDLFAANGDSIFHMPYVHTLHVTFPYSTFYDSLIASHTNDYYLQVQIDFNGEVYTNVGIKAKGNSSFNNPSQKKSFKIDMNEFVAGQDIHGLKKLNFNNGFKDPSFMREKLANDFLSAHQLPAPRVTYCNVYFNNQLWGLYAIVEEVDDEFCKRWFNSNDGNLFKGDPHGDLKWKGSSTQSLYESSYELKNNNTANNWADLISLIDVINNTPSSNLPSLLDAKLNTNSFIKHWAAMNLFSSLDAYIGSGHNYYIYHDTITNKFQWIAWDNNEAFGSFKNGLSSTQLMNLDMYYVSQPTNRPLVNNMLNNAYYKSMYNDAYCALQQDFTNTYFDPIIDSIKNKIQASVYADTKKFYSNGAFDSTFNYDIVGSGPGSISIFGLKPFIANRSTAVQNNMASNGVICFPLQTPLLSNTKDDYQIYPNPCNDILYIKSQTEIHEIELRDLSGRIIFNTNLRNSNYFQMPISSLSSGQYLLHINREFVKIITK